MLINGHDLNVEQHGPRDGPDVILLHHGLGSIQSWREQIPVLAKAGYHITAYDRWGYGGSEQRAGLDLPTFTTDINDLYCLLGQLGIQRVALIGHSDGGTISFYFAAQYPNLVSCLVSVAAHIYIEPRMEQSIQGVRSAFDTQERFRKGLYKAHGAKFETVFHNWFDGWHQNEFLSWDIRPILERIRCPALIVQGELDEHATPQHAKDAAEAIPGAEAWIVPQAGHMLPLENAEIFNPRLLGFLKVNAAIYC